MEIRLYFQNKPIGFYLYTVIVPNQNENGMSVFYMLCTKDKNGGHEGNAIKLALSVMFASIGEKKPSAININKYKIPLNSIHKVIFNDIHC